MPRTRFEDDPRDDDFPPRPERSGSGLVVGLLVAGGLLLVLVCGGGLAFLFLARTAARDEAAAVADRQAAIQAEAKAGGMRPVLSRPEFEAAVRGKTRDEVTRAVGPPDHTHEEIHERGPAAPGGKGGGPVVAARFNWRVYRNRVTNEATGKPYPEVRVRFGADGTVDRIEYP